MSTDPLVCQGKTIKLHLRSSIFWIPPTQSLSMCEICWGSTLQVTNKQTPSWCWALGIKMRSGNQSLPGILTCLSIYAVLNPGLKGEAYQFTTNKQFSKTSISVFTNTHYCLYIWNSLCEVCRNIPCCQLHNFRIFPVYYATIDYNQAVSIPDIQLHCTTKNILNYCCQKWTVPHKENCIGAKKNEVDLKTSPLGNGTVFTKRSKKATWKNVDKSTSNGLLSSIDFRIRTDLESIGFLSPVSTIDRQSKAQSGFAYCLAITNKVNLLVNVVLLLQATVDSQSLH